MTITKRIASGPVERLLLSRPDIYPDETTADLADERIADFKRRRSARRMAQYDPISIKVGDLSGRLVLVLIQSPVSYMLGYTSGVVISAIRLEFDDFTIVEFQEFENPGHVKRSLSLGTNQIETDAVCSAAIGKTSSDIIPLPELLASIFKDLVIEEASVKGAGTAYTLSAPGEEHSNDNDPDSSIKPQNTWRDDDAFKEFSCYSVTDALDHPWSSGYNLIGGGGKIPLDLDEIDIDEDDDNDERAVFVYLQELDTGKDFEVRMTPDSARLLAERLNEWADDAEEADSPDQTTDQAIEDQRDSWLSKGGLAAGAG